ncbi:hypothetical protein AAFF_G00340060 [Aldrovandia affinis]|uniref:Ig-like domain-containing protein n=1 Tax=Aldrovandia affinis TaxID=143900 RepID=A0AAD7WPI3_9TELE|nr:hypothetical protein AAFF_G00340060 [Aldrovandia affinis]
MDLTVFLLFLCSANIMGTVFSGKKLCKLECKPLHHGVSGQDTRIQCFMHSCNLVMTIIWNRNESFLSKMEGEKVSNVNPRYDSGINGTSMWLLVRNTNKSDEGRYNCEVQSNQGSDNVSTTLRVTVSQGVRNGMSNKSIAADIVMKRCLRYGAWAEEEDVCRKEAITRTCRFSLHNIRRIRPFLTQEPTQLLILALLISPMLADDSGESETTDIEQWRTRRVET